jgi:hypothetical protein
MAAAVDAKKPKPKASDFRDERAIAFAHKKGKAQTKTVIAPKPWGGAMRRILSMNLGPSREDQAKYIEVPGRYVPVGFARYKSPVVDPLKYTYYRVAGWRVAVPSSTPGCKAAALIKRIYVYGPQSAGYVRMGDTLVPAIMNSGDRMTLAQSAYFDADDTYPLSQ